MRQKQLGILLIVTLVALRVAIGMHFFREGINKTRDPKPFSAGFFGIAKGPLDDSYRNLVWDADGFGRLDVDATLKVWDHFRVQVAEHFGFDTNQQKRADAVYKRYVEELREHILANADDIREYRHNIARRDEYRADPAHVDAPSLRVHIDKIESDIRSKRASLLGKIDSLWKGYEHDLNGLCTAEQGMRGAIELDKPARRFLDTETIDKVIPWFDMAIGVLLIAGLLTRPAAVIGALFLLSVAASQWPTTPGASATWPQWIEALGLLVVAAAGAGDYAGFDALLSTVCCRRCSSAKQGTKK